MSRGVDVKIRKAVDEAARLYKRWHQKEPDEIQELEYPLEEYDLFECGYADSILYVSDKWEDDGVVFDYSHEFDTGPGVFMAEDDGSDPVDTEWLLGSAVSKRSSASLPVLAGVKELILVDLEGKKRVIRFKVTPMLLECKDKKGLLIISNELGPIFIRGGKMHVTERGIHR